MGMCPRQMKEQYPVQEKLHTIQIQNNENLHNASVREDQLIEWTHCRGHLGKSDQQNPYQALWTTSAHDRGVESSTWHAHLRA